MIFAALQHCLVVEVIVGLNGTTSMRQRLMLFSMQALWTERVDDHRVAVQAQRLRLILQGEHPAS